MGIESEVNNGESVDIDLEAIVANESIDNKKDEIDGDIDIAPQLSEVEQKAFDQGWRPQEEFNGPEDNWKTAKEYVRDGEFLATIKEQNQKIERMNSDFNERLESTNKLHEARRLQEIKDLKAQQREAVDDRDTDAYDSAQAKIETLEAETPEKTETGPKLDPTIARWEKDNPWINDDSDERAPVAQGYWNHYQQQNPNATVEQALAHVDAKMGKLFPANKEVNPRRNQPNVTENNQRSTKRQAKELSMGDLTQAEMNDWNQFGSSMFTEKEFLKTVKDTRVK